MLILRSSAKLNLYLEVLNLRKDKFHNINTIFERISLSDKIILKARRDNKINISCNNPSIPLDSTNLCYRSAKLLQDKFNISSGVDIKIIKRIPIGAGLGGGSSNAACTLLGLNKLWKLRLSKNKLINLAKKVGSDVSFFVYDTPFAKGAGRGDIIRPLTGLKGIRLWHILLVPKLFVSTPLIYKKWDACRQACLAGRPACRTGRQGFSRLTKPRYNVKILTLAIRKKDLSRIGSVLFNSLEEITLKLSPEARKALRMLEKLGLKSILMSGSGPAIFGIVSSRKEAVTLSRQLGREQKNFQVFIAKTC